MGVYSDLPDGELVRLMLGQDRAALGEIYKRYFGLVYQHTRKMLHSDALAEDIVQDIFAKLLTNTDNLKINGPVEYYLYRAAKNRVIDNYDKSRNRQQYIDKLIKVYDKGIYQTDEAILENEMKRRIESAVASFPPKMREIFEMSRNAHLSRKHIAKATNVTEGTVNIHLNRALKILRSKLTLLF